jgi:hypothetical protein
MSWPFKTTVKFESDDGRVVRLEYAVSAGDASEARTELEKRFLGQEVFGYVIERVTKATRQEAASLRLPTGCVMLLA